MGLNLCRDVHLWCRSRELVEAGSQSDVTATKSSSSSTSLEGRGFYRPCLLAAKGFWLQPSKIEDDDEKKAFNLIVSFWSSLRHWRSSPAIMTR